MKRALVTGGSGFLGSTLCRRLIECGVEVHSISRTPTNTAKHWWRAVAGDTGRTVEASEIQWWKADLVELEAARVLVRTIRPDVIFHLASLVTGSRGLDAVIPTFQANLVSTINILVATAEANVGKIVFAGSMEEPDAAADSVACSPYAAAKWSASSYAKMFHDLYRVPVVVAKIFMVYGPGQQDHTKLIPYLITSLLRGEQPKLSSGTRLIDWIFVDDVVDGLVKCGQVAGIDGCTLEFGSGTLVSIRDIVSRLRDLLPGTVSPQFGALPDRPFERVTKANIDQSHKLTGWLPATPLGRGLLRTIDWYKEQASSSG